MFKLILFDIDGVLIRLPRYFSSVLEENGYKGAASILNKYYHGTENSLCLTGKADPVLSIKPFLDRLKWEYSPEEYFKQQYEYESGFVDLLLIQKIINARSKGVVCTTATDQDKLRSEFLLDNLNFRNIFDENYISNEAGFLKKDDKYWDYVIADINTKYPGIHIDDILYCDDIINNIETASKTGIKVMHIMSDNDIIELYRLLQ